MPPVSWLLLLVDQVAFHGCLLLCIYGLDQEQPLWVRVRRGLRRALVALGVRTGGSGRAGDDTEEEEEDDEEEEGVGGSDGTGTRRRRRGE